MIRLDIVADKTKYHGWTRAGFHAMLVLGILLLIFSAYVPWFLYPSVPLDYPFKTYAGHIIRDAFCVVVQYYFLVFLFTHYGRKPWFLVIGMLLYYFILFTCYYYTSYLVKHYCGLPDDYTGSIGHFDRLPYWKALLHPATFYHLMFIIERAFYPLALKLLIEIYRRQVRNANLQQDYNRLELDFLKNQISPHFLFNVLNSIYALTEEESPRAAKIVQQLSGMMRYSLYETADAMVPLHKELAFIRNYVELEQLRTSKRLTLEIRFPDSVDHTLVIAPFVLITFIENAFKHGVGNTTKKSFVKIDLKLRDEMLNLSIENSKPVNAKKTIGGLGLVNVRKRLAVLYPDHKLLLRDDDLQYTATLTLTLSKSKILAQ
jgi:two-component system LytT family sensor kinase